MGFKSVNFVSLKNMLLCTNMWHFVLMIIYNMLIQKYYFCYWLKHRLTDLWHLHSHYNLGNSKSERFLRRVSENSVNNLLKDINYINPKHFQGVKNNAAKSNIFEEHQLITVSFLVCDSYLNWSTRFVFLKVCVGSSIFDSILFS